jgi:hypothetical protein
LEKFIMDSFLFPLPHSSVGEGRERVPGTLQAPAPTILSASRKGRANLEFR